MLFLLQQELLREEEGGERKRKVSLRDVLEIFEHYEFHNKSMLILPRPTLPLNL